MTHDAQAAARIKVATNGVSPLISSPRTSVATCGLGVVLVVVGWAAGLGSTVIDEVSFLSTRPSSLYSAMTDQTPVSELPSSGDSGSVTVTPQVEFLLLTQTLLEDDDSLMSLTRPGVIQMHLLNPLIASNAQVMETEPSWPLSMTK